MSAEQSPSYEPRITPEVFEDALGRHWPTLESIWDDPETHTGAAEALVQAQADLSQPTNTQA
jgi:hypothetical protein